MVHMHACRQAKHSHKIKQINTRKKCKEMKVTEMVRPQCNFSTGEAETEGLAGAQSQPGLYNVY